MSRSNEELPPERDWLLVVESVHKDVYCCPLDPTRPNRATMFRNVVNRPMASYKQKRSFQHAARAAELRSAFKSTASVANARRRKPRRLLSTRCERLEQQVAKAIVDAQNRPEREQNRSTGQERLQSRDGQKFSAPQWNRERRPSPEAKYLSSNLLKL